MNETEQLLQRYKTALERIEKFGHSHGHGHGYTCANIAEEALKGDPIVEDSYNDYPPDLVKTIFDELGGAK
jgi:hypothetical protein